ncbi:MAG: hypothetical protein HUU22_13780 [Phycisphaerae bacterium]|nr:hypothetical protein [Phycisphaerae bacterium]NUQ47090.1 hypothetical protein [Phycisphaerae bacterium]
MKVAILGESSADEAVVRIFVDAILGEPTDSVERYRLRSRGWPAVLNQLPAVLHALYYQSDADALVVVVDSDSHPHDVAHDDPGPRDDSCHLCAVRSKIDAVRARLRPVQGRGSFRAAAGLAVPALEAWLWCGQDSLVTEQNWINGLWAGEIPYTKLKLKQWVYGTDRPDLVTETTRATERARRLAENLAMLEERFPIGFGALCREVRGWRGDLR